MSTSPLTTQINNRYRILDSIGQGSMGTVYSAFDRLNNITVALKRVHMPNNALGLSDTATINDPRIGLANEFKMLASLRHPNVISVLDYGFDEDRPFFTMELVENARDFSSVAKQSDLHGKVLLLVDVLQGLIYLHRHGIIHSDLKPSNILIDTEGRAKILDFGLAMERNIQNNMRGTLAYMAPEVMRGDMVSEATDLYALGVIAYEMFTGKRPFDSRDFGKFVVESLQATAPLNPLKKANLPPALIEIIARLLEKLPQNRQPNALAVQNEIASAMGIVLPPESTSIRDSFLRAAPFVGRKQEIQLLKEALHASVSRAGSAWLVGGETGVGKTRLLNEFRSLALVNGALVLRGQARQNDVDSLWRDLLRNLLLSVSVTDREAGILKHKVPEADHLLERHTTPSLATTNLKKVINTFIKILKRQKRPTVILIEDLHWTLPNASYVNMICKAIQGLPIVLVSSYCTNENQFFYGKVPFMKEIRLSRLNLEEISELSTAILGRADESKQLAGILLSQTEGNTLFIIEVMQTLSEHVKHLTDITLITIPDQILVNGLIEVTQRRLRHLMIDFHPLLRVSAVLGRKIQMDILQQIDEEADLLDWLHACVNASIVELNGSDWQFAHDKLRDAILLQLPPKEIIKLHVICAKAIEALYPNNPIYYKQLLKLWSIAGNPFKREEYLNLLGIQDPNSYDEDTILLPTPEQKART
jgi:eukaryotic-like serine/threonine-protein kinase